MQFMKPTVNSRGTMPQLQNATLENLASIAKHANVLAHLLDGSFRNDLFALKSEACEILLIKRWAVINGVHADGFVALTIRTEVPTRVHVHISDLSPRMRSLVRATFSAVPATASVAECLAARRA